jgi:hypothetical protein
MLNAGYTHLLFHRNITFQLVSVVALKFFLVLFFFYNVDHLFGTFYIVTLVIRHPVARTAEQQVRLLQRTVQILKSQRASKFFRVGIHHCQADFLMVTCETFNKHGELLLTFIWAAMKKKKRVQSLDRFIVS